VDRLDHSVQPKGESQYRLVFVVGRLESAVRDRGQRQAHLGVAVGGRGSGVFVAMVGGERYVLVGDVRMRRVDVALGGDWMDGRREKEKNLIESLRKEMNFLERVL
jgi:hypothetical protein